MGQFDQTGRQMAKLDGAAFLSWALSCCDAPPALAFLAWDDTRRLVIPGEGDLVNDCVMQIRVEATPDVPAWLITEIEDEADRGIFSRVGRYELALLDEVAPRRSREVAILSLVLNLSGRQKEDAYEQAFGRYGMRIGPLIVDVAAQGAAATLERIERGELGLTVLPFCALMTGGDAPDFIRRWMLAVMRESDEGRRLLYRDWALVMAELTRWQPNWQRALEGWMERKSVTIEGWKREGRDEGRLIEKRADILRVAQARLNQPVPDSIRDAVEGSNDLGVLDEWLTAAALSDTVAELRRRMQFKD
ncbi:MAG: hypothetical protein ACRC33_00740 [Gemmataceae bacterium]